MILDWLKKYIFNNEAQKFIVILTVIFGTGYLFFNILMPLWISVIIAYLLSGIVEPLTKVVKYRIVSTSIVVSMVCILISGIVYKIVPKLLSQFSTLVNELPALVGKYNNLIENGSDHEMFNKFLNALPIIDIQNVLTKLDFQKIINYSFSTMQDIIGIMVYVITVPIFVFLLLLKAPTFYNYSRNLLKNDINILACYRQISLGLRGYVLGKIIEFIVVSVLSVTLFWLMSIKYFLLMALLVGMSILVPYLGAFLVTIPVLLLGYSSLGLSENFLILILSYCGIQIFDANILFPLIFTGIIKTSSLTILISILFFGTIYGVPGAFFAIPLIVVIKSIYMNWPYAKDK